MAEITSAAFSPALGKMVALAYVRVAQTQTVRATPTRLCDKLKPMSTAHVTVPLLQRDDQLTPDEFLDRWDAMPNLKFAELIDGVVYLPSPLGPVHAEGDGLVAVWTGTYAAATPGCRMLSNGSWRISSTSVPQPDVALCIRPEYGGQSRDQTNHVVGVPELVAEICESSAAYDLGPKLRLYEKVGVREYITMLPNERQFIWRELFRKRYRTIPPDSDGLLRSRIFPGL